MNTFVFLFLRSLHMLLAAVWLGTATFVALFLMPTIQQVGPAGGQVMVGLVRRGFIVFIAIVSGLTALTGLLLYWRLFETQDSGTPGHALLIYTIGSALGLIAAVIAGGVVGRNAKRVAALLEQMPAVPESPQRAAIVQTIGPLRQRAATGARIVVGLLFVTLILMSLGHYV